MNPGIARVLALTAATVGGCDDPSSDETPRQADSPSILMQPDTAEQDHELLQRLVDDIRPMARHLLGEQGEFIPIAAWADSTGTIAFVAIDDGDEFPSSVDMIEKFRRVFREQAIEGAITGAAIAYDVRVRLDGDDDPTDAICIDVESPTSWARVVQPYRQTESGLEHAPLRRFPYEPTVFTRAKDEAE